jgi:hypothetical protein
MPVIIAMEIVKEIKNEASFDAA